MQTVTQSWGCKRPAGLSGPAIWLLRKAGCAMATLVYAYSFVLPIVLFTALFLAYPVIYSVALSFRDDIDTLSATCLL